MTDAFDVSVYLMACARDCLDEPPLFGPRRMVEAAARLTAAGGDDPRLRRLGDQIEERHGALLGMDRDDFAVWLDEVVGDLAGETLRRELATPATGGRPMGAGEIVDRFWTAYNAHDTQAVNALYRADATHHEVAQGRRTQGSAEIAAGLRRFLQSFPDASWEERRRVISADGAAVAYRLTGHLAAPMGPFRTPGQQLDLEGMFMIECADGAIVATADYWDAATFGRQMQGAD